MIKIFNKSLLSLCLLFMSVAVLTSCEKDDNDATAGGVELLSFGPTGAKHGDTLRFIGNNLDAVTAIQLTGALVPQASFVKQTSDGIWIVVPKETARGPVMLKTAAGDIVSKTSLDLSVTTKVTGVTPQARPGANITITGDFLNWATRVTFNNNKVVDSTAFVSKSITQLVVRVPMDAQTGRLVVSYGGVAPAPLEVTTDTVIINVPLITGLAPNPVKHKTNLTITGTDLDLATQILFPGGDTVLAAAFVSQSASQIVVSVPSKTRKGKITLVAPSGVKTVSAMDVDVILPAVTSMSPNPVDPLADLTIDGTNLDLVTSVSFTGALAPVTTFVSKTPTQIVVRVPAGTLKGKVTLAVLNSSNTVQSTDDLRINGGLPPLSDFAFPIYTDVLHNTFQDWSYTTIHDFNSTANVRQGTKSVRGVYAAGGYQGLTFHAGTAAPTAGYTRLEFSVFGEAGTGGKKLNVVVNGNYATPQQVTVLEGEWATFSLTLTSIGAGTTLSEIVLQSAGWGGVIHVDHVGLR